MTTTAEARLLVVEDDANIRELLGASLRHAGFEVDAVDDGAKALAALRREEPDLVVLDVMMPGIDGFEVVRRLRADGHRFPVLFLTARDSSDDAIRRAASTTTPAGSGTPRTSRICSRCGLSGVIQTSTRSRPCAPGRHQPIRDAA